MQKENLREKFENIYNNSDPWKFDNSLKDISRTAKLLEFVKDANFSSCLDIGCGEGAFTNRAASYFNEVDAFDISLNAIKRAKNNFKSDKINFYQQDAAEFKATKKYDVIFCLEMLYYLDEESRRNLLSEINNSLADNGILILSVVCLGKNQYGDYFTHKEILKLLSTNFRVITSFSLIPKSKLISAIFKAFSVLNFSRKNFYKTLTSFIDPSKAYQSGFLLIKNSKTKI